MSIKILIVDGYDYEGWKSLNDANCVDAFEHYINTLKSITKYGTTIESAISPSSEKMTTASCPLIKWKDSVLL